MFLWRSDLPPPPPPNFILNTSCPLFTGSVGLESPFKHLYKVNFDNMASYLQKKQERLDQESMKRAAANGSRQNKRSKTQSGAVPQSTSWENAVFISAFLFI